MKKVLILFFCVVIAFTSTSAFCETAYEKAIKAKQERAYAASAYQETIAKQIDYYVDVYDKGGLFLEGDMEAMISYLDLYMSLSAVSTFEISNITSHEVDQQTRVIRDADIEIMKSVWDIREGYYEGTVELSELIDLVISIYNVIR